MSVCDRRLRQLITAYAIARQRVIDAGYFWEIEWQEGRDLNAVSESEFLRETAWVILAAGMRESVVRNRFPSFSRAFFDWESASVIVDNARMCFQNAMAVFGHERKVSAVLKVTQFVVDNSMPRIKTMICERGTDFLETLPYVGPITSFHLAKNLGLDVAKSDRHLVRITRVAGFKNVSDLCSAIAVTVGERMCVVDTVLWRFATIEKEYLRLFQATSGDVRRAA